MTNQLLEISDVAKETITVLNYFNTEFVSKIPSNVLEGLKEVANKSSLTFNIKQNKKLAEQKISEETKDLISLIYYSYIATEEQKKELKKTWNENELLYQEELRKKYNTDNIFKRENTKKQCFKEETKLEMIEYKKSIFKKIIEIIKGLNIFQ